MGEEESLEVYVGTWDNEEGRSAKYGCVYAPVQNNARSGGDLGMTIGELAKLVRGLVMGANREVRLRNGLEHSMIEFTEGENIKLGTLDHAEYATLLRHIGLQH